MSNLPSGASEAQMIDLFQNFKMPVMGAGGGFAPIGTINFFDASIAPQGWLACDGNTYNIADYPDLATYYASVHGASNFYGGDGTTTFAVPDLRGEFLRGTGTNSHSNQGSGANVGVHQDGTESMAVVNNPSNAIPTGFYSQSANKNYRNADSTKSETYNIIDYRGNTSGTDTGSYTYTLRPTNTSFLICVKATVADAEINAFNVYTPREHQVAWWEEEIDGVWKRKPVYEKRLDNVSITKSNYAWIDFGENNHLISVSGTVRAGNADVPIQNGGYEGNSYNVYYNQNSNGRREGICGIYTANNNAGLATLFGTYTKTTDEWQTS